MAFEAGSVEKDKTAEQWCEGFCLGDILGTWTAGCGTKRPEMYF